MIFQILCNLLKPAYKRKPPYGGLVVYRLFFQNQLNIHLSPEKEMGLFKKTSLRIRFAITIIFLVFFPYIFHIIVIIAAGDIQVTAGFVCGAAGFIQ